MAKKENAAKRKKPKFLRVEWHKKIKLGRSVKKNRKWRAAKGIHNKIRLNNKGRSVRPRVGFGSDKKIRGMVNGFEATKVMNLNDLKLVKKEHGIIIGKVGRKKREEIIRRTEEIGAVILNKYGKGEKLENAA